MKTRQWFRAATVSVFLCLVPGAIELPAQTNVSRWEPEIRAFVRHDRTNPPPQHAVLFIGSSSIRKWTTLAQDFPGVRVINRGFGGSEIHDSTEFADRIIFPYHPRVIVLYAGDNDLAAGMPPDQVVAEYSNFVATVHAKLPRTRIVFISIKPSPARKSLKEKMFETNQRIAAIKGDELAFVDIFPRMLDKQGNPRKDLFLPDGLHPNEKCYRIWAAAIKPYLRSSVGASTAGEPALLLTHAHAHNDYEHVHPLFDALAHGFCSVEADIFLVNGRLLVAHTLNQTKPARTLQALYLNPLRQRVRENGGRVYPNGPEFTLLIDMKEDWRTLYPALRATLTNYADMLTTFRNGVERTNAVLVIISGNRSETMFRGETVRYAALDGTLNDLKENPSPLLVPWISADWKSVFHWNGFGTMPAAQWQRLNSIVREAHEQGRQVRFWDAPDFPNCWRTLRAAGVDLINTDHLAGVEKFFKQEN